MRLCCIFILLLLQACQTLDEPIPEKYTGETAQISDSITRRTASTGEIYYLESILGQKVDNALIQTRQRSGSSPLTAVLVSLAVGAPAYGSSAAATYTPLERKVPAGDQDLHVVGVLRKQITGGTSPLKVEADFTLHMEANKKYYIRGRIEEPIAAIWIENFAGKIVTPVVQSQLLPGRPVQLKTEIVDPADYQKLIATTPQESFFTLKYGDSYDYVLAKLGNPNNQAFKPSHGGPAKTRFFYDDFGEVRFLDYENGVVFVEQVLPTALTEKSQAANLKRIFYIGNKLAIQNLAKAYPDAESVDVEILDILAEKVWQERFTDDDHISDTMAWFCKALAKFGDGRYRDFIGKVANTATTKRLIRHATNTYKKMPPSSTEQFTVFENPAG